MSNDDMLTREQAAQILGVPGGTLIDWVRTGKVTLWQWFHPPTGGQRRRVYPRNAVEQLKRERAATTFPPAGFMTREEACRMFGVASRTWSGWEERGRITCGQFACVPGRSGAHLKVYPKAELERLAAEWNREQEEESRRLAPIPIPNAPVAGVCRS